ncbi:2224_t:CDS:1, partial [Acaulospora colombiana]
EWRGRAECEGVATTRREIVGFTGTKGGCRRDGGAACPSTPTLRTARGP